ncbi:hypothetical protein PVAP13_9KG069900 [Panicum virgatum]|uniref:Uncharacterized protein n=1 Tax=Panicum virgatum TaxID=38727 RepID=A0A8T0NCY2_PANVG|nr:hypothetical protein PVAP13_9KG069900 [Panicum virgatum]
MERRPPLGLGLGSGRPPATCRLPPSIPCSPPPNPRARALRHASRTGSPEMLPRQLRECGERAVASDGEGLQPPLLAAAVREETGTRVATRKNPPRVSTR